MALLQPIWSFHGFKRESAPPLSGPDRALFLDPCYCPSSYSPWWHRQITVFSISFTIPTCTSLQLTLYLISSCVCWNLAASSSPQTLMSKAELLFLPQFSYILSLSFENVIIVIILPVEQTWSLNFIFTFASFLKTTHKSFWPGVCAPVPCKQDMLNRVGNVPFLKRPVIITVISVRGRESEIPVLS